MDLNTLSGVASLAGPAMLADAASRLVDYLFPSGVSEYDFMPTDGLSNARSGSLPTPGLDQYERSFSFPSAGQGYTPVMNEHGGYAPQGVSDNLDWIDGFVRSGEDAGLYERLAAIRAAENASNVAEKKRLQNGVRATPDNYPGLPSLDELVRESSFWPNLDERQLQWSRGSLPYPDVPRLSW